MGTCLTLFGREGFSLCQSHLLTTYSPCLCPLFQGKVGKRDEVDPRACGSNPKALQRGGPAPAPLVWGLQPHPCARLDVLSLPKLPAPSPCPCPKALSSASGPLHSLLTRPR